MADFDGQQIDLVTLFEGQTAAQLIASANAVVISPIRRSGEFGPGWFLDEPDGNVSTGKVESDG